MLGALSFLVVGSILVAMLAAKARDKRRRIERIAEALGAIGGQPVLSGSVVQGTLRGVAVSYELVDPGENAPARTVCRAFQPNGTPAFEMDLRPQNPSEEQHVRQGRAIDLVIGDPAFDDAFIVEAAPADVARSLLDQTLRAHLLALHPCRLKASSQEFSWQKQGWVDNAAEARRVIELCVGAADRLGSQPAESRERQMSRAFAQAGYRGPSPEDLRVAETLARDAGLAEIEELHAVRVRRRAWYAKWVALAVGGVLLTWWVLERFS